MLCYWSNTFTNFSLGTVVAPNSDTGDLPLPTLNQPPQNIHVAQQQTDTMSQLTEPSIPPATPIRTLLGPANHRIPCSPEKRAVGTVDNDLNDTGYDSDGRREPWEGIAG